MRESVLHIGHTCKENILIFQVCNEYYKKLHLINKTKCLNLIQHILDINVCAVVTKKAM